MYLIKNLSQKLWKVLNFGTFQKFQKISEFSKKCGKKSCCFWPALHSNNYIFLAPDYACYVQVKPVLHVHNQIFVTCLRDNAIIAKKGKNKYYISQYQTLTNQ